MLKTSDFDYELPPERIAQTPAHRRDESRLLVLSRGNGRLDHRVFRDLPSLLHPGDLLVLNDSRVLPARLRGVKPDTGGRLELLLLEERQRNDWLALFRPAKRIRPGSQLRLSRPDGTDSSVSAEVLEKHEDGLCRLRFEGVPDLRAVLDELGRFPCPPMSIAPRETGIRLTANVTKPSTPATPDPSRPPPPASILLPSSWLLSRRSG